MRGTVRVALGSLAGAAVAAVVAPATKGWFAPPGAGAGVGWVTVNAYPKGWDYAVVALLFLGAFAGGVLLGLPRTPSEPAPAIPPHRRATLLASIVVFVLMFFIHDHPYAHMDPFHEGEHLTAGWLMKTGERPYGDFYIFHGLAVDAGLDVLSLGDPPSPLGPRRLQTVLDALTVALLVPIAAELTVTTAGMLAGVLMSLCAIAALWLPVYPFFRLLPVHLAALAMLRYVRHGSRTGSARALLIASVTAGLGVLWSLDTGLYAVAAVGLAFLVLPKPLPLARVAAIAAVAAGLPFVVLLAVRADIRQFLIDSFVIMPRAIDAIWALPAPAKLDAEALRYYLPPVLYGFFAALGVGAWRRGDRQLAARLAVVTIFSLFLFRSATGRVSWSHIRFALPLLGIALVAFILEPLVLKKRAWAAALLAIPIFFYLQIAENVAAGAKLLAGWPARQRHENLVPYPFATGRGLYTGEQNAIDLASLKSFLDALGPADAPILDFSNERALYYLLQRKPPLRCMEISMLSVPEMLSEAMAQLNAAPPVAVVVSGYKEILSFDGVPNDVRVPELARWIEANYPKRTEIGRFVVAHK